MALTSRDARRSSRRRVASPARMGSFAHISGGTADEKAVAWKYSSTSIVRAFVIRAMRGTTPFCG